MMNERANFPSRPHDGATRRIEGAEPFVQVFPLWGTNPTFFLAQFSVAVPIFGPPPLPFISRFTADGDAILESIALCFDNENYAADSPVDLILNGQRVPFPSQLLQTVTVGNGILDRFPLNLFLKKGDSLAFQVIGSGWTNFQNETFRNGTILIRYWTL